MVIRLKDTPSKKKNSNIQNILSLKCLKLAYSFHADSLLQWRYKHTNIHYQRVNMEIFCSPLPVAGKDDKFANTFLWLTRRKVISQTSLNEWPIPSVRPFLFQWRNSKLWRIRESNAYQILHTQHQKSHLQKTYLPKIIEQFNFNHTNRINSKNLIEIVEQCKSTMKKKMSCGMKS